METKATTPSRIRHERCPMEATLDVIGGRWKGVILYHLLAETKRFGELRRLLPAVSQRMLTLQLRELEEDGVIHREIFKQIPPKVEYSLTEFGRSLEPALLVMSRWGKQYLSLTSQASLEEALKEEQNRPVAAPAASFVFQRGLESPKLVRENAAR